MRRIISTIVSGAAWGLLMALGALLVDAPAARAQDGSEVDPLLEVAAEMNSAAVKLAKLHTDTPTQTAQQNALKKLDEVIARLEEKEKQGRGRGTGGNRPAQDSQIRNGPGGMGTLHAERREGKQWGDLPPKERERILQSMNDGFPSSYQKILERYFARLADEKPLADTDAAAGTPPADGSAESGSVTPPGSVTPAADAAPAANVEKEAK